MTKRKRRYVVVDREGDDREIFKTIAEARQELDYYKLFFKSYEPHHIEVYERVAVIKGKP